MRWLSVLGSAILSVRKLRDRPTSRLPRPRFTSIVTLAGVMLLTFRRMVQTNLQRSRVVLSLLSISPLCRPVYDDRCPRPTAKLHGRVKFRAVVIIIEV